MSKKYYSRLEVAKKLAAMPNFELEGMLGRTKSLAGCRAVQTALAGSAGMTNAGYVCEIKNQLATPTYRYLSWPELEPAEANTAAKALVADLVHFLYWDEEAERYNLDKPVGGADLVEYCCQLVHNYGFEPEAD